MNKQDACRCPLRSEQEAGLLLDYCARKLDQERRLTLERHMLFCPECARFRDSQAALWNALDQWESSPVAREFDEGFAARIARAERDPLWIRAGARLAAVNWTPAVLTAAAAALGILLLRPAPPPQAVPVPDTLEPEQVERVLEDLDMLRQIPL